MFSPILVSLPQILEALGVLQRCRRFAGTSGGSIIAAFLAIDLGFEEIRDLMKLSMRELLIGNHASSFLIGVCCGDGTRTLVYPNMKGIGFCRICRYMYLQPQCAYKCMVD